MELLEKLARGLEINDNDIKAELYYMCDRVHAYCDEECIVNRINGGPVNPDRGFEINRGCDCFKSGSAMLNFIRNH